MNIDRALSFMLVSLIFVAWASIMIVVAVAAGAGLAIIL